MRAQVTSWLNDTVSETFPDTKIDTQLQSALETLCNLLMDDNRGKRCLRKISAETAIVADQKDYAIPADCLRIDRLQYSVTDGAGVKEWYDLEYAAENLADRNVSGTSHLFGSNSAKGVPSSWFDDADDNGYIRVSPTPAVASEYLRFRYYFSPEFPIATPTAADWALGTDPNFTAYTAGTYVTNDGVYYLCDTSHTASAATEPGTGASWETVWSRVYIRLEGVPAGFDTAIEYLAVSRLAGEELEDGKPIGYFNGEFNKKYRELVAGAAGGQVRPQRRYVNMVN
ncbi:MAG TPA: hypothetical protein DCZ94_21530 [Lentisphaeria bacterium]|nr:MAG: hypothetical protein A2X48_14460 [Lentisphaerae bacterium GWF2_49_21]HBC89527.1 hypothetical protein [Lentisphaeria bacterium]